MPRLVELAELGAAELRPQRGGAVFLAQEARRAPYGPGLLAAIADPERVVVVGVVDDYPAGFGVARTEALEDGPPLAVVEDLFVEAPFRAVGVGEAMMNDLVAWAEARGCRGIDAVALPGARDTKNFFETFGLVARLIRVYRPLAAGLAAP